tara:strand:- start:3535 stop:3669 length:135 start_codon:yes stop_codon:yes gene_type:complete
VIIGVMLKCQACGKKADTKEDNILLCAKCWLEKNKPVKRKGYRR